MNIVPTLAYHILEREAIEKNAMGGQGGPSGQRQMK